MAFGISDFHVTLSLPEGGGPIHMNSHINCPNYTGLKPEGVKDFSSWVLQNRPS